MKILFILVFCSLIIVGCNPVIGDNLIIVPEPSKSYDTTKGGIQILSINPSEFANGEVYDIHDEWITLFTQRKDSLIHGWQLNTGLFYLTCDTTIVIKDTLRIYSHSAPSWDHRAFSFNNQTAWLWSDTGFCSAILKSSDDQILDSLRYYISA